MDVRQGLEELRPPQMAKRRPHSSIGSTARPEASTTASVSSALTVQTEYTSVPPARVALGGRAEEARAEAREAATSASASRAAQPGRRGPSMARRPGSGRSRSNPAGSSRPSALTTRTFVGAGPPDVLLELACPGLVHLEATTSPREHRRLAAGRRAEIEHSLSLLRADAEPRPAASPGSAARSDPLRKPVRRCGRLT